MAVDISEVLEAARANIASFTGANVALGAPVDSETGLFVFAYKFSEDPSLRHSPSILTEGRTDQSFIVRCLLMPSHPDDYVLIGEGMRFLTEQPVFNLGESTVRIMMSQLPNEELTRIFISAGITLRVAIHFELRWTASNVE